jgi:hypothetical protein
MGDNVFFDPTAHLDAADAAIDLFRPWTEEDELPPVDGRPSEAVEVNPLRSDQTPPTSHAGTDVTPGDAPGCPVFHKNVERPGTKCAGLPASVRERADEYQRATVRDGAPKVPGTREMRHGSAIGAWRMLAHYATIGDPAFQGLDDMGIDRYNKLRDDVIKDKGGPSPLQRWSEAADFGANGLLRLLYLYSHRTYIPDEQHAEVSNPVIPCDQQDQIKEQLLGFKYFMDEPARHPEPKQEAVYWSENHQLLYATAEYLAGQLMPDERFAPSVQWRTDDAADWQGPASDPSWVMSGHERMDRAYPRLVRWLDHRLMFGFSEWNSPVYYDYDIAGLLNLIDFCDDQAVADKATIALDLVLLDLARFSGRGRAGSTSGRAYTSHKLTGWGATVANSLQILFGMWDRDPDAEEVMEDWRIEHVEAERGEFIRAKRQEALEQAEDDGVEFPEAQADRAAQEAATWYDLDRNVSEQLQRQPPPTSSWVAADSAGAHALATSQRYCLPELLYEFARDPETPWFERSRRSVGFEEGRTDYDIGYTDSDDLLAWWSRGGFATKHTIAGSRTLAIDSGVTEVSPFSEIPGMFDTVDVNNLTLSIPDAALEAAADLLSVESEGSCLTTANVCLWREKGLSLSSVQKFRVGQVGRQAHLWQATLDPYTTVWSTQPAAKSSEGDNDGPSWWAGNASQPRIVQHEDALICAHDSILIGYISFTYGIRSHAWFPVRMFHEAFEVRALKGASMVTDLHTRQSRKTQEYRVNSNERGTWWFGRRNDSYVGLFSAKESTSLLTTGRWADREILCEDRVNIFICQVGTVDRFGSFPDFMHACTSTRIHIAKGVYQPSNPFVDVQCSYDIPGKQRLELHMDNRWPRLHGQAFSDEAFPRWRNPWNDIQWRERVYTLAGVDRAGQQKLLHHNCTTGARTGDGV